MFSRDLPVGTVLVDFPNECRWCACDRVTLHLTRSKFVDSVLKYQSRGCYTRDPGCPMRTYQVPFAA